MTKKRIAIIGAGFTGLSAGYTLAKQGNNVTIYEKDDAPGGLAIGYQEKNWEWSLEKHYHHWFTNDQSVLDLAKEINHPVVIKRPKTSSFINDGIYQLDSPLTLLRFPKLSIINRLRTGISLAALRYNPYWKFLERFHAEKYLKASMGKTAYAAIWEPLMVNKLGVYAKDVSLAWFWARISKRTSSLAYPKGGYLQFANDLVNHFKKYKGTIEFNTEIKRLSAKENHVILEIIKDKKNKKEEYDQVIVTTPSFLFLKIAPDLPVSYTQSLGKLKGIGAMNMILRMDQKFFKDNTYWLNMCDKKSPILAVVEHTNFMSSSHYGNEHIVYVGNYMKTDNPLFTTPDNKLFDLYAPTLTKINPEFKKHLIDYKVFRAPFAQPIIPINYSKMIPPFETPFKNVYLANIEQVYPWDRGTNYSVEMGIKIANMINENTR